MKSISKKLGSRQGMEDFFASFDFRSLYRIPMVLFNESLYTIENISWGEKKDLNFYISSRLNNIGQVRHVANLLKGKGWTHTCDWTRFDVPAENSPERLRMIGERECDGVKAADIVLVLTPQGRGTHIELGMAIALEKRVYIYHGDDSYFKCDDNTCAFYWLPQVKQLTGNLDTAIEVIVKENTDLGQ